MMVCLDNLSALFRDLKKVEKLCYRTKKIYNKYSRNLTSELMYLQQLLNEEHFKNSNWSQNIYIYCKYGTVHYDSLFPS
jgi:hypothetical protein